MPTVVPIGGTLVPSQGGWIDFYPEGTIDSPGVPEFTPGTQYILDASDWDFVHGQEEEPLYCSGQLGVPSSRRVAYNYSFRIATLWDAIKHPEVSQNLGNVWSPSIRQRDSFQMVFRMGTPEACFATTYTPSYWFCAYAVADKFQPILDAGRTRLIGQIIDGHTKCAPLLLPQDGYLNNVSTVAGAYYDYVNHSLIV